ncbi:hypothetical protein ACQ4PT_067324 [Festuca glaucescens]
MSVLPIPKGTLAKMDRPQRSMFWKAKEKCSGGDCQVAWDYVCRLRSEGGLGVIDLGLQNKCLLLKAIHGLFTGQDSPWTRWVKRIYLGDRPQEATPAWKCFQSLIPLYRSITRVEPRDGRSTSLWHDAWTPLGPLSVALPAAFSHCLRPLATVADALESGVVGVPLVHRVTAAASGEMEFVHACLSRVSLTTSPDVRTVALGPSANFSMGCVYRSLHSSGCIVPGQGVNWDCFAPLKVRVFFWIMRLHKTRTRALLHRLGCVPSPDCPFCSSQPEDISHLFVGCPHLRPLWSIVSPLGRPHADADVPALLDALSEDLPPMHRKARNTVVLALLWSIWKSRDRMVFDADLMSTPRVLDMLVDHLRLWVKRIYLGDRPQEATLAWKCFQSLIPLYRSITRVEPRDGRSTLLWHDAWTPLGPLSVALPAAFSHCLRPLATIADALESGAVGVPLVHRVTAAASGEMEFVHACLSRVSLTTSPNVRTVALGPSANFSTGCVYRSLHSSGCIVPGQGVNWDCFAPLKVRVFFWIMRLHKTRTRALLHRLGCVPSPDCPFCSSQPEDISHLFVGCPHLRPLWSIVSPSGRPHADADVPALLDALSEDLPPMHRKARNTVVLALLWSIWKSRDRMVFDADLMSTPRVLDMLVDHLRLWVIRAPPSVDTSPLLAWCRSVS